jgi:LuxR family maltose regulon positive regulatory protein
MNNKTNPLLPTKLYAPPLRKILVARMRLLKQLNRGMERRLTLISAPAGYGKSTLLSEFVRQAEVPAAWLSLDKGDNDPLRFWSYFVAALQTIPGLENAWNEDIFQNIQKKTFCSDNDTLLTALITKITTMSERVILILDDLQTITEDQVLDGLFYLLENLYPGPVGVHIIIASRSDPPWPLARLRVADQITEIRSKDLSFTLDETNNFINGVMGLALSSDEISELGQRTEGWIAGLQMAAISMQDREDISEFLEAFTGSHRFVLDYLIEEVLSKQKPEILDFLLKTSILERMTISLCDAITGKCDAADVLSQLEKANLFLIALDEQRIWYRYHQLFADLLHKQLRLRFPEQIADIHRIASHWHAHNGLPIEAVEHALKSEDWEFAATQVEEFILALILNGEMRLARQWIGSLPKANIRRSPALCIAQAWTSAEYASVELAEDLMAQAETALVNTASENEYLNPEIQESLNRQIAVLQVVISRVRGDSTFRQQALALETLDHLIPIDDIASRATLFLRLGFCYLDLGKDDEADRVFSQAFDLGIASENHYAAHVANYGRMVIARRHGQLNRLAAICRQSQEASTTGDKRGQSLNGIALIMDGRLLYERNDLEDAESRLVEGLQLVKRASITELLIKGNFALVCLNIARGKQAPFPELEKMAVNSHPGLVSYAAALDVQLQLLKIISSKDILFEKDFSQWVDNYQLQWRNQSSYDWEIAEHLIYARALCWQYKAHPDSKLKSRLMQVLEFIMGQCQTLEDLNWKGTLVEVNIVITLILYTLERETEALHFVEKALTLADTPGYLRVFLDEGQPMKELLQLALAAGIREGYTRRLLLGFGDPTAKSPSISPPKSGVFIDPLSKRELQVLRLLKTSLSVPEIAEDIHLSPTTVRTHVQHIYQKLGVHGRIAALQRAEEVGIL